MVSGFAALSAPAPEWTGVNRPRGFFINQGYNWAFGNPSLPHHLLRSLDTNHENFTTTRFAVPIFAGDKPGLYIACGLNFKGFAIVWKFPGGCYAYDTRDANRVGGRVGAETTFVLLQRLRSEYDEVPIWAQGGIDREGHQQSFFDEVRQFNVTGGYTTPAELKARAGNRSTLDEAFINLLPASKRAGHEAVVVAPRPVIEGPPAIEADGLTCRFGQFTAVDHVSFRIERGEIFGFLGSNGCGKTTTMKMLTGLLPATSGEARLFGQRFDARDMQIRRRVGYMSQSFSLYSELTVRQNLLLHARLFHIEPRQVPARIAAVLARFDLADVADNYPEALSLGVRQRLQLATAVLHRPDVLILDEPTSGLHPAETGPLVKSIERLRDRGNTVVAVEHSAALLAADTMRPIEIPLGLDLYMPVPEDNPITTERVERGRKLFFDTRLSRDRTIACASCHDPERAFSDGRPVAKSLMGCAFVPMTGKMQE